MIFMVYIRIKPLAGDIIYIYLNVEINYKLSKLFIVSCFIHPSILQTVEEMDTRTPQLPGANTTTDETKHPEGSVWTKGSDPLILI